MLEYLKVPFYICVLFKYVYFTFFMLSYVHQRLTGNVNKITNDFDTWLVSLIRIAVKLKDS